MTFDQIRTFLAIVEFGSISAASEAIFASQPTISNRIQLLEEELGVQLIIRNKGVRTIELTDYGKRFIPIAHQWTALWKETKNLKTLENVINIKVGSVDLINSFTFMPFYENYLKKNENIKLNIQTFHSSEIYTLVENRIVDIGFVFSQMKNHNIISTPIYREKMYLICNKKSYYHNHIYPHQLDVGNEIFLNWGEDFLQWHNNHWDPNDYPLITINTGNLISKYLTQPERWAIAPMSLISSLKQSQDIACYQLQEEPPPRICYQLTHRYTKSIMSTALENFEQDIKDFIQSNENICRFEPWMMETKSSPSFLSIE